MARTLDEIIADLPSEDAEWIQARSKELIAEVESLRELRRLAGKAQAEIAETLRIKQPSVSKIENQADMYLSTLRSYVEAVGGELDLVVRLPERPPIHLRRLGDLTDALSDPPSPHNP